MRFGRLALRTTIVNGRLRLSLAAADTVGTL
jgi:hypothetical protein